MRFTLERVAEPEIEPITDLDYMRRQLRAYGDVTAEDADIQDLFKGGREWAEYYTGRALIDQTWRLTIYGRYGALGGGDSVYGHRGPGPVNYGYYCGNWAWPRTGEIALRRAPALSIVSFATVDAAGAENAIDADTYELREADSKRPRIVALDGATWSAWTDADIRITFRAGYANRAGSPQETGAVVPVVFRQAIVLWAQAYYAGNDQADIPAMMKAAEALLERECIDVALA